MTSRRILHNGRHKEKSMGKGDQRSRRGKIWRGTFGKRRPKKSAHAAKTVAAPGEIEEQADKKKSAPPARVRTKKAPAPVEAESPES
jgi:30S ribosomal protein S31